MVLCMLSGCFHMNNITEFWVTNQLVTDQLKTARLHFGGKITSLLTADSWFMMLETDPMSPN